MLEILLANIVSLLILMAALALCIAIIPLSAREAGVIGWRVHTALAFGVMAAMTFNAYRVGLRDVIPLWQVALAYSIYFLMPLFCAGFAARYVAKVATRARWPMTALATALVLVGSVVSAYRVAGGLIPDSVISTR